MQAHISGTYLGCGRVWSGADGCEWVYMGALGYRGMGGHTKKTGMAKNGLVGPIVSVHVWPGNSPENAHM